MILVLFVFVFSCSQEGGSNDSKEKLTAHCIRECVLETGASEICDTECRCSVQKLLGENSEADFKDLVQNITQDKTDNDSSVNKFKNALNSCKDLSN